MEAICAGREMRARLCRRASGVRRSRHDEAPLNQSGDRDARLSPDE